MSAQPRLPGGTPPGQPVPRSQPALSRLIAADPQAFAAEHWGTSPLLSSAGDLGGDFADLLDADAVDELVSTRGLRTPFLRIAQSGATLPTTAFTAGGGIGAGIADQVSDDRLVELFAGGATLVLQGLHRIWPPILDFCQQLAADLGHPVQANAYVTPPQNQGFDDHYDVHDVFVLQITGEKQWTIHAPVLPSPLRTQPWTDRKAAVRDAARREPLIQTVLRPGDCLYLPRGYLHAARALGGVSTHLTIGVHSWNRHLLAEELTTAALAELAGQEEARTSLDLGVHVERAEDLAASADVVRKLLVEAVRAVPDEVLAAAFATRSRSAQRAAPIGPLAQLEAAASLGADTRLRLRRHLQPTLRVLPDGSAEFRSRAGRLAISAADLPRLEALLDGAEVPAGSLGLDLARSLLRAAVAVPADPAVDVPEQPAVAVPEQPAVAGPTGLPADAPDAPAD